MIEMAWDFIAWLFIGPWWMLGTLVFWVVVSTIWDEVGKRQG